MEKEEAKALQELTSAINTLTNNLNTDVKLIRQELKTVSEDVCNNAGNIQVLTDTIKGNGNRDGLVPIVKEMNKDVSRLMREVEGTGEKDRPGLIERMGLIEDWVKNRVWVERVVVSGLVLETIGIIFLIIKSLVGI